MDRRDVGILIIDDVQAVRGQVRHLLMGAGYKNITGVENGVKALQLLEEKFFQLIICDWHMEPIDGLAVLRFIKNHPIHIDSSFIMLTAEDAKERVIEAISLGVSDYLIKPLTVEKLNTRIDAVLRKRKVIS